MEMGISNRKVCSCKFAIGREFNVKTLGLEGVVTKLKYSGFFNALSWLGFRSALKDVEVCSTRWNQADVGVSVLLCDVGAHDAVQIVFHVSRCKKKEILSSILIFKFFC